MKTEFGQDLTKWYLHKFQENWRICAPGERQASIRDVPNFPDALQRLKDEMWFQSLHARWGITY